MKRLRDRPAHPDFERIFETKKYSFRLKMEEANSNKSPDWKISELEDVLDEIKKNKACNPYGLNRSIFHSKCIGSDLKKSLLILFNKIKTCGKLPDFMKKATISTIPKSGSKLVLKNERGIVVLSSVRTIFMRLVYKTKYDTVNSHMSDSNVGGRKNMSCINHIFVLNGIIHDTVSSKKKSPVTIQIYDYKQMFDSMDLDEALSDLFDSWIQDDTLALLYDANRHINVRVKTPCGLGVEKHLEKVDLQGDTWGLIMASK